MTNGGASGTEGTTARVTCVIASARWLRCRISPRKPAKTRGSEREMSTWVIPASSRTSAHADTCSAIARRARRDSLDSRRRSSAYALHAKIPATIAATAAIAVVVAATVSGFQPHSILLTSSPSTIEITLGIVRILQVHPCPAHEPILRNCVAASSTNRWNAASPCCSSSTSCWNLVKLGGLAEASARFSERSRDWSGVFMSSEGAPLPHSALARDRLSDAVSVSVDFVKLVDRVTGLNLVRIEQYPRARPAEHEP